MWTRYAILLLVLVSNIAGAWGDEGHEIVALVADHYLESSVRDKVSAILAGDKSGLTTTDIAHEATWADKYRDSDRNTTKKRYNQTHLWHFVDIELANGDLDAACFGHPTLPPHTTAFKGPPKDCVVDKIKQFSAELANSSTSKSERRAALQFILHFVGDMHQPLHASDDHDRGGNDKHVSATGFPAGDLHAYWDTDFVEALGPDANAVSQNLIANITDAQVTAWSQGTTEDWARESFQFGRDHAYGNLPAPLNGVYHLDSGYVTDSTQVVAMQLSKAGVRLASILNRSLQ